MAGWVTVTALVLLVWSVSMVTAWSRRSRAVALLPGEDLRREIRGVTARVFVSHALPGGIRPNRINRGRAHMVLTSKAFRLATGDGKVLDLGPGAGGRASCTGPRRLVLEATWARAPQPVLVRVELVVNDAEIWARQIQDFLSGEEPTS